MYERLILSVSLIVVVLGIAAGIAAADVNPVCWWKLDGNASDSSTYNRDGTVNGGPAYAAGYDGDAIVLDGVDDSVVYGLPETSWAAYSVALWVKTDVFGQDQYSTMFNNNSSGADFQFDIDGSDNYRFRGASNALFGAVSADWTHLAATCDGTDTILYRNGNEVTTAATADTVFGQFAIGVNRNGDNWFAGSIDDVRVYDRVLSEAEIRVMAPSGAATLVSPADGARLEQINVLLTWQGGAFTADVDGHRVYLGDNYDDVEAGTGGTFTAVTSDEFFLVSNLDTGKVHYWRINEVNDLHPDSPWTSEVWSFTVPAATAWDPSPADNGILVDPDVSLSWDAGLGAVLQDVYFGDNFADVDAGTGGTSKGQQTWTSYTPGSLDLATMYYWRVDTIKNAGPAVKGPVWSFMTRAGTPIVDPNLVGWWKLDNDGSDVIARDYSGRDHYGTLRGGAQFVPGYWDGAVELDGVDGHVTIDGYKGVLGTSAFSVAGWIKTASADQIQIITWGKNSGRRRMEFRIQSNRLRAAHGSGNVQGDTAVNDGDWHHVAVTVKENATTSSSDVRIYMDGEDDTLTSTDEDEFDIIADVNVGLGYRATHGDRFFDGLLDEFLMYDRVLSPGEIAVLARRANASNPSPSDGARYIGAEVTLEWDSGRHAAVHNVYFGTDPAGLPLVSGDQPVGDTSYGPANVELGQTYYWYVDEVNGASVWAGDVWSFDVEDYLLVDDFDSYASTSGPSEPSLLSVWTDGSTNGTGADISLDTEFAGNSMRLDYDNTQAPLNSEAELVSPGVEDWTAGGAKAMALDFHGDVNNTGGQLYVALEDADGGSGVVTYEGDLLGSWETWNISLQDFADEGVDLTRVKKLIIGVMGDGFSGFVNIDDIKLYPPRCLPEYAAASFDGDCATGWPELNMIIRYWLVAAYDVAAAAPDSNRLEVHYKFDEVSGTVAQDSSGAGRDGTVDVNGADAWDPGGYDGYCLAFDGNFAVSVPNDVFAGITDEVTISVWVYIDANANPNAVGRAEFGAGPTEPNEPWDRLAWIQDKPEDYIGQWNHYAFVKAAGQSMMRIYHNGVVVAQNTSASLPMDGAGAGPSTIGAKADGSGGYSGGYKGKLDDFRIYDYALGHSEILYLALGSEAQMHQPLQPVLAPADPYPDGIISFKDVAILGQWWLGESLWP